MSRPKVKNLYLSPRRRRTPRGFRRAMVPGYKTVYFVATRNLLLTGCLALRGNAALYCRGVRISVDCLDLRRVSGDAPVWKRGEAEAAGLKEVAL